MKKEVYPEATKEQINEGRNLAWLAYFGVASIVLPFLFFVPMLIHKSNPFSRFHARQGLAFFIFEMMLFLGFGIIWFILKLVTFNMLSASHSSETVIGIFYVSFIAAFWNLVVGVGIFFEVLAIIGIVKSVQGRYVRLPIVRYIAEKWFKRMVPDS